YDPIGLTADAAGNIYVADRSNATIRKISPAGVVTTVAGAAGKLGNSDGAADVARFNQPYGIAVDRTGNLFVTDKAEHTIRKISPNGVVSTIAGVAGTPGATDATGT